MIKRTQNSEILCGYIIGRATITRSFHSNSSTLRPNYLIIKKFIKSYKLSINKGRYDLVSPTILTAYDLIKSNNHFCSYDHINWRLIRSRKTWTNYWFNFHSGIRDNTVDVDEIFLSHAVFIDGTPVHVPPVRVSKQLSFWNWNYNFRNYVGQ